MKNILGTIWKEVLAIDTLSYKLGAKEVETQKVFLGIVAKKSDGTETWKAYFCVLRKATEEDLDTLMICKHGTSLNEIEARAFFPELKNRKYRH